jgi:hypothetical protein
MLGVGLVALKLGVMFSRPQSPGKVNLVMGCLGEVDVCREGKRLLFSDSAVLNGIRKNTNKLGDRNLP